MADSSGKISHEQQPIRAKHWTTAPFRFRFYDKAGKPHRIRSPRKLLLLIDHDIIGHDTPILDENTQIWSKAVDIKAFQVHFGTYDPQQGEAGTEPDPIEATGRRPGIANLSNRLPANTKMLAASAVAGSVLMLTFIGLTLDDTPKVYQAAAVDTASTDGDNSTDTGSRPTGNMQETYAVAQQSSPPEPSKAALAPVTYTVSEKTLSSVVTKNVRELEQIRRHYDTEIRDNGILELASPAVLSDSKSLRGIRNRTQRFSDIVAQFEDDYRRVLSAMENDFREFQTTTTYDRQTLNLLNHMLAETQERFDTLFNHYKETVYHLEELQEFITRSDGYYVYSEEQQELQFDRDSEAEYFEELITGVDTHLADADQLHALMEREAGHNQRLF